MNDPDDKLHALLQQWRTSDPPGSFEPEVWRRIRATRAESPVRGSALEWLSSLLGRPAFAIATAAAVAMLIGAAGAQGRPSQPARSIGTFSFSGGDTLAGGYAQLTGGDQ